MIVLVALSQLGKCKKVGIYTNVFFCLIFAFISHPCNLTLHIVFVANQTAFIHAQSLDPSSLILQIVFSGQSEQLQNHLAICHFETCSSVNNCHHNVSNVHDT